MKHRFLLALALLACLPGFFRAAESTPTPEVAEFFEKKIRPVLIESCWKCHSAEAKKLKGGLRLDSRAGLLKGGTPGRAWFRNTPRRAS